jgi:release factor glutamine methyltransferase
MSLSRIFYTFAPKIIKILKTPLSQAKVDLIATLTPIYGASEARSMARILFEDYFNWNLHSESDNMLFEHLLQTDFQKIRQRLLDFEPIQYIVGFAWFYGQKFKVNPTVLIPRPETEELVHWILETCPQKTKLNVLDIGTGSGCIPIILKQKKTNWEIAACDVSESALITASRNAYRLNVIIDFQRVDILNTADWHVFPKMDVIVSNPPYIPFQEKALMHENVLKYEPHLALFVSNENPLLFYETIAHFALKHLNSNGFLFFECNEHNATAVVELLEHKKFQNIELRQDMSGKNRMVRAKIASQ